MQRLRQGLGHLHVAAFHHIVVSGQGQSAVPTDLGTDQLRLPCCHSSHLSKREILVLPMEFGKGHLAGRIPAGFPDRFM